MRVLHIGKFWPPYAGGIESAARDLCLALAAAGEEVRVLAHAAPGTWRGRDDRDGPLQVELAACPGQLAYAPLSPGFGLRLNRILARWRPQLLHLHLPNPSAFWALLSPAARRLPWVLHWHADVSPVAAPPAVRALYPLYRPWEQALLRRAAAVICTSPDYRDASVALARWREKTRVIPLGVDPAPAVAAAARAQARALWPGSGLRVLATGRLSHYKGFDVLLRAVARAPAVQLLLLGDGECAARLQALVQTLDLGARVHLAGRVSDAVRDAACLEAELFCLPSLNRSEAFGVVLLEALRAGLPVLASRVAGSGMLHVLDHGAAGALVEPGDAAGLAAALEALAADPERRARLAAGGQARWAAHFTLRQSAAAVRDLHADLLRPPPAP